MASSQDPQYTSSTRAFDQVRFSDSNYLKKTWTGRILILNTFVFLAVTVLSGALFSPPAEILIPFGAKDPVSLAHGQWWRFLTPVFLHIGLIHFLINSAALKYIGRLIEQFAGGSWFLLIYLASGLTGNICSFLDNTSVGAGASGAIFGLVGTGVVIEWLQERQRVSWARQQGLVLADGVIEVGLQEVKKRRLIPGPFTFMAVLNIALAMSINFLLSLSETASIGIDNAAHLGGLGAGLFLGWALLLVKPNPWLQVSRLRCLLLLLGFLVLNAGLGVYLVRSNHIKQLFFHQAQVSQHVVAAWAQASRGLQIDPFDPELRFFRGKLLLKAGEEQEALEDFKYIASLPEFRQKLNELAQELYARGDYHKAGMIREFLQAKQATPL